MQPENPAHLNYQSFQHSPQQCFNLADALWYSAEIVSRAACRGMRAYEKAIQRRMELDDKIDLYDEATWTPEYKRRIIDIKELVPKAEARRIASMLVGLSIENELKGAYYAIELSNCGHVSKINSMESHNLPTMARRVGLTLDNEESALLEMLYTMIQLGRYPIAKMGKKNQRTYQVNYFTAPGRERALYEKVKSFARGQLHKYQMGKECDEAGKSNIRC